ncbi:MAG: hypothetical protein COB15_02200 [Flavobacteriales bacterium]|nr:MAG: hypothetical protein COB15_02200 [Flavobacteriales bacterium]
MAKSKIIALVILAIVVFTFFQWAFIGFSVETQLLQALSMAVTIIAVIVAIFLFNKGESSH